MPAKSSSDQCSADQATSTTSATVMLNAATTTSAVRLRSTLRSGGRPWTSVTTPSTPPSVTAVATNTPAASTSQVNGPDVAGRYAFTINSAIVVAMATVATL